MKRTAIFLVLTIFFSWSLNAQTKMSLTKASIKIDGTSSLHDWDMTSAKAITTLTAQFDGNKIQSIKDINFSIKIKDLKSTKDGLDANAYKALKEPSHPNITFKASSATVTTTDGVNYTIRASGNMTMAGVTKPTDIVASGKLNSNKSLVITGTKKLDMTTWGVKPPSFMMGAMKTGKDVVLTFNVTVQ